jgi:8-oxo-dGTP pyrophosphatase MutT (NUDIX family)
MSESTKTPIRPAATILLLRDGAAGLEVFMVKRHHQIDFMSGALVFPGGKIASGDDDPALKDLSDGGEDWDDARRAFAAAAIREAFEESGILLARDADGKWVSPERLVTLDRYRSPLDKGEIPIGEMLKAEKLKLAFDALVPYAHWITPEHVPKRFDTYFFAAVSPVGHAGRHDGRESVDSVWIGPRQAVTDKKWNVVFPTRLNLEKLARSNSVEDALSRARSEPVLTVLPWVEKGGPNGPLLRIREDAGYDVTSILVKDTM